MLRESVQFESVTTALVPLSSISPTAKLAAVFVFTVCVSLLSHHSVALVACVIPFLLSIAARLPLKALLKKLLPINFFFIFLWLLLPLSFSSGTFSYSHSGVELAALITLKGNAIAAMLLMLTGTSTINESCRGLLKLRLPEKLVTLLLLTHSNLDYMMKEYVKISTAAKLRGFVSTSTWTSYKTSAYLAAMLLVRSLQRAQRVSKAMRLRGFAGKYPLLELPPNIPYRYGQLFFVGICFSSITLLLADIFI